MDCLIAYLNAGPDKYKYSGYGFDFLSEFSFTGGSIRKNVNISEANISSIVHIDKTNKDILILDEGPTQGLDVTTLTAEAKYPINFTQQNKRFALNLLYNGSNSFLFVNATKIHHFKAKDPELKHCWNINEILCLGNISKDLKINNFKTLE